MMALTVRNHLRLALRQTNQNSIFSALTERARISGIRKEPRTKEAPRITPPKAITARLRKAGGGGRGGANKLLNMTGSAKRKDASALSERRAGF